MIRNLSLPHGVAFLALLMFGTAMSQTAATSPDAYKKHMDDVQETKDDLADAVEGKNLQLTLTASRKLADLLHTDIAYWQDHKADQAAELARISSNLALQIGEQAQHNDFSKAHTAVLQLQETCRTCHDAHPEKIK